MALMETLTDDFSSGTIDTSKWTNVTSGVSIVSGRIQLVDSTGAYPFASSAASYDIRNSYAFAEVTPAPRTGGNSQQTYFAYYASGGNGFGLAVGDTTLYKVTWVGGTETDTAIATYSATTHAWWRIRHNGTNVVLGWSSDGLTWTEGTPFASPVTLGTSGWLNLNVGRWQAGDTATAYFDNINIPPSTSKSGSDTASGVDSAGRLLFSGVDIGTGTDSSGTVARSSTGSDTATGTDSSGTLTTGGSDTASGADSAGSVATFTNVGGSDTASGADSGSLTAQTSDTDTASGSDASGSVARSSTSADTGTATEAEAVAERYVSADTGTGTDSAGTIAAQIYSDSDTGTAVEAIVNRTLNGGTFNEPVSAVEASTVANLAPIPKSGADSVSTSDADTKYGPGQFTSVPVPRTWVNGDSLDAGTLNKEWRDTFNFLLRKSSPAYTAYNLAGAPVTANVAVALTTEEMQRGNVYRFSLSDTKLYVWEAGVYLAWIQFGATLTGVTGTNFSTVLKVNGLVAATSDITRAAGTAVGLSSLHTVYLNAGDYVEVALGGSWSGTVLASASSYGLPLLNLWWRNN